MKRRTAFLILLASTLVFGALPGTACAETTVDVGRAGIRNDGSDVTLALQRLLDSTAKPCTFTFPQGTYRVINVHVPSDVTLAFDPGAVIRPARRSDTLFRLEGVHDVEIAGGVFYGQGSANDCISAGDSQRITISGARMYGPASTGFRATDCDSVTVAGCGIRGTEVGVEFERSSNVGVERCRIIDSLTDGILFFDGCEGCTASGNTIDKFGRSEGGGHAGIQMYGSWDGAIVGNTVRNGLKETVGIRFRDSEDFECSSNRIEEVRWKGIEVVHIDPPTRDFLGQYGIYGGDGTIARNTVSGVARGIIADDVDLKPLSIFDNRVSAPYRGTGLSFPGAISVFASGSEVVNNTIVTSGKHGIRVGGSGGLVAYNTTYAVGVLPYPAPRAGIFCMGEDLAIVDNHFRRCSTMSTAIALYDGSSALVARNTLASGSAAVPQMRPGCAQVRSIGGDTTPPEIDTTVHALHGYTIVSATAVDSTRTVLVHSLDGATRRTSGSGSVRRVVSSPGLHRLTLRADDVAGNHSLNEDGVPGARTLWFALGAPWEPRAVAGSSGITVRWHNASRDVAGTVVERARDIGGRPGVWSRVGGVRAKAGATRGVYVDRAVAAGATYHYRLRNYWRPSSHRRLYSPSSPTVRASVPAR